VSKTILSINEIGADVLPKVGGKGANLGELTRAGFNVSPGFCVTTDAFDHFMSGLREDIYAQLDGVSADDLAGAAAVGQAVREQLGSVPLPVDVSAAVVDAWRAAGVDRAYAVRSSATAEDLPSASFAGQQDTYLNVRGEENLLAQVKACFVSLFTDRAILYRIQHGFEHRQIKLSVVVQQIVQPEVAGILFTADPVSGHRKIISIDASFGLGEALVAGLVSSDLYRVHKETRKIVQRQIAEKQLAIRSLPEGGTEQVALVGDERTQPALNEAQVLALAEVGARIEAHYGSPQDIEWAIADGEIYITQSRPITSLYPLPMKIDDQFHVYASLSHFQMLTDAMPPMALSLVRIFLPFGHDEGRIESKYVFDVAGRIYGDFSPILRHPIGKRVLPRVFKVVDELGSMALVKLANNPRLRARKGKLDSSGIKAALPYVRKVMAALWQEDPEGACEAVNRVMDEHIATIEARINNAATLQTKLDIVLLELQQILITALTWVPKFAAGIIATVAVGKIMHKKGCAKDIAAIGRGLTGNIVSDMGLDVGDLADAALASEELANLLMDASIDTKERLACAAALPGGETFLELWGRFITRYGSRGPAELDISRPRWTEDPTSLLQMVVGGLDQREIGTHRTHFAQLQAEGMQTAERLTTLARKGLVGQVRGRVVARLIRVSRALAALREHHKFLLVRYLAIAKQILLAAGEQLQRDGKIDSVEDIWFLTYPELVDAVGNADPLQSYIEERVAEFEFHKQLNPPRVMTSEGEIPSVKLDGGQAPEGALLGSPASAGIVEGIAKVVRDPIVDMLMPGEILVAPFTDPGWTPLFVNAAGVVVEVGGVLSHGSVVAREYGIPAVVSVLNATGLIQTGQHIRVHGDAGYVEILD